MSVRDKFLKNFDSVSNRFAKNIAVYYASDLNYSLGISYLELNRVSNELGRHFSKLFGENYQYIGVSLSDYFFLPCVLLGIWKCSNCFAGVGTQYTIKNNLEFLDFLRIKYLITDTNKNQFGGKLVSVFFIQEREFFVWSRPTEEEVIIFEGICYGIMTSGSTGEPKMIQVPWSCILPNAVELSAEFQVTELDCIFLGSPYSFDPFFIELFMAFLSGSTLMIVSNAIKLSPPNLLKALFISAQYNYPVYSSPSSHTENENCFNIEVQKVNKKNTSILQITPSVFRRWTDSEIQNFILSLNTQLRILILGGENFPREILKLKSPGKTTRIFNIYGITEISCWAFLNEVTSTIPNTEVSIGKPLNSIMYKISEIGEFEIGSNARICTVNREESSHDEKPVFRKTGDLVELINGEIHYVGRTNQVVKKYGLKINLTKIENLFMRENKLIKECFCIYDEENLKLALFYIPAINKTKEINYKLTTVDEFQKNNYKIPADQIKLIEKPDYLVEIQETPLNSHGKCDKQQLFRFLKDIYKSEQCNPDVESTFRRLWHEVLGGTNPNILSLSFLELGGDSVLALDLINKLEDRGVKIPQNFVAKLLGGESFNDCLECLHLAEDKSEIPGKRIKFNTEIGDVKLSLGWKFDLGKCVDATPVIFVHEGEEKLVVGSHSYKLSCINPNSGCEIWTTFLGDRIESGFRPTRDGSRGFIGCYDHFVYCLETSQGSVMWKFKTDDMVKSTPCLSSDEQIVYVASYDKHLYCLSTIEGKLKKSLKLSNGGVFCSGIVSDSPNSFFIGTLDGTCLAIDQETNEPTWKATLESPVFATPCLIPKKPEILFSEVLGNIHCLNSLNGNKIWTFKADGNIYSSPSVQDPVGIRHIIFGCHDAHLYCLQYETEPKLKWKQRLDSSVFAKPFIVLDFLSVSAATTKGFVYLCDFALDGGRLITNACEFFPKYYKAGAVPGAKIRTENEKVIASKLSFPSVPHLRLSRNPVLLYMKGS